MFIIKVTVKGCVLLDNIILTDATNVHPSLWQTSGWHNIRKNSQHYAL